MSATKAAMLAGRGGVARALRASSFALAAGRSRGLAAAALGPAFTRRAAQPHFLAGASRVAVRPFSSDVVPLKTPGFGAESITEGTIMEWKVKVGDQVKKGELLVVIETDKVSVEVNAEMDGEIVEIFLKADDTAEVGKVLCNMRPGSGGAAPAAAKPAPAAAAAPPAAGGPTKVLEVKTPPFGAESITEGTLQEWRFKVGDWVNKGDLIAAIETDKVSVEVNAPESGELSEILAQVDDTVKVDALLCKIKTGGAPPSAQPAAAAAPAAAPAAEAPKAPPAQAKAPPAAVPASEATSAARGEERVKMPRMRMAIARNLKNAQNTQAALSTFNEVDMSGLMTFRKEYKDLFEKTHGAKFGLQSIFFKAAANALLAVPSVNAAITGGEIVYRDYVDIGFAAATPKGLVVPIIRNVETLSILGIEKQFAELAGKAKADKIGLADMEGGTFSISNGGVFGSMLGTPMIGSTSQSAIMGLHATKMRPVVMPDGSIKARPVMYVALTYDHRLVDGREAVTFLKMVKDQVEKPERLVLEI